MGESQFKDHFSGHADHYRHARPGYPAALYEWLAARSPAQECVWDAGCGNGQASVALAAHFRHVIATDPSAAQIANALAHENVSYRVEPAEASTLADNSVDLVTVAQALHWFDHPRFYAEARRVARAGALLAAWTYALCSITAEVDAVVARLYDQIVGPYWPPERRHTEDGYASLPFPFAVIEAPAFAMQEHWTLTQFCAYLRSWSATQRHIKAKGNDPVLLIEDVLAGVWGSDNQARNIRWPLSLRAGRLR